MNNAESSEHFMKGVQNIERAIIDGLRAAGGDITEKNFTWHRGKELLPPPMAVELQLRVGSNEIADSFSREEVIDSWDRISRSDTRAKIRQILFAMRQ